MILSGDLSSGQKLNELSLAESMAVSRGTVREAIRSLADSGLIDLVANRGAFVRRMSVERIADLYHLRGAIFSLACGLTAQRFAETGDDAVLDALLTNLDDMRQAFANDDRAAYYKLNIAFHDMLLTNAGNVRAKEVYDGLVKEMHLFRRRGLSISLNIASSIAEHEAIVNAVKAGDPQAARDAAIRHIDSGMERFMMTLTEQGKTTI